LKIAAFDPATAFGWAFLDTATGVFQSGVWDLTVKRDEGAGMKLLKLETNVVTLHRTVSGFDLVVFEAARHANPKMFGAVLHQAKLQAILERFCARHEIAYRGYSPTEIKKFAVGIGNARKDGMLKAVRGRWKADCESFDEADAIATLYLAVAEYGDVKTVVPAASGRMA